MTYAKSLHALADPTRRRLSERLRRRPHTVGELARAVRITQPAVSQHLRVLRAARLVTDRAFREELGSLAESFVREHFDAPVLAARQQAIYEEVLGRRLSTGRMGELVGA